ncbi:putative transporter C3H1.06c [Grifola frondosa]|uniref:Putative transporter C3H1.06c n=1 Tax=Grifola frondosa TaxID=5627 RepID=A0A1C7M2S6_GRIFR|nr:putative transporter C3H1.06c [Grifola frondosa]
MSVPRLASLALEKSIPAPVYSHVITTLDTGAHFSYRSTSTAAHKNSQFWILDSPKCAAHVFSVFLRLPISPLCSHFYFAMPSHTNTQAQVNEGESRGFAFWMTFVAICSSLALFALELTSVATALPTIVSDLHARDFVWAGSSYVIASTAFIPLTGSLSQIFGRKPIFIGVIIIFGIGSAVCGAAHSDTMLIVGRTIQGVGGGGIVSLTEILLGDLVPLRDRGLFFGLIGLTFSVACAVGPIIGGSLASSGAWRWLFYLNLPICGVCIILLIFFLRLKAPELSFDQKLARIDWTGNIIVIGCTTACAIALAWGGVEFAWPTARVLAPLCIGLVGLFVFLIYEERWAREPIIPFKLMSDRTSASGYLQDFFSAIIALAVTYYLPVYWQACKGSSALKSGVQNLGFACIAPASIVGGIIVAVSQKYCPILWLAWALAIVGMALFTTVTADTATGVMIGFSVIVGCGIGVVYAIAQFPVQAPQPVTENARSMALFGFVRSFASIWGISMGNAIIQNELTRRLPPAFLAQFPGGIPSREVRAAFAAAIAVLWKALTGVAGAGFIASLFMREIPMHATIDENWDLSDDKKRSQDAAGAGTGAADIELQ